MYLNWIVSLKQNGNPDLIVYLLKALALMARCVSKPYSGHRAQWTRGFPEDIPHVLLADCTYSLRWKSTNCGLAGEEELATSFIVNFNSTFHNENTENIKVLKKLSTLKSKHLSWLNYFFHSIMESAEKLPRLAFNFLNDVKKGHALCRIDLNYWADDTFWGYNIIWSWTSTLVRK